MTGSRWTLSCNKRLSLCSFILIIFFFFPSKAIFASLCGNDDLLPQREKILSLSAQQPQRACGRIRHWAEWIVYVSTKKKNMKERRKDFFASIQLQDFFTLFQLIKWPGLVHDPRQSIYKFVFFMELMGKKERKTTCWDHRTASIGNSSSWKDLTIAWRLKIKQTASEFDFYPLKMTNVLTLVKVVPTFFVHFNVFHQNSSPIRLVSEELGFCRWKPSKLLLLFFFFH